jgi:hypothetical protein
MVFVNEFINTNIRREERNKTKCIHVAKMMVVLTKWRVNKQHKMSIMQSAMLAVERKPNVKPLPNQNKIAAESNKSWSRCQKP